MAHSINDGLEVVTCGSYRRGKPTCGDVDILVTHPDGRSHKGVFTQMLEKGKEEGFLTDDLSVHSDPEGQSKYLGVCKLGEGRKVGVCEREGGRERERERERERSFMLLYVYDSIGGWTSMLHRTVSFLSPFYTSLVLATSTDL